MRKKVPSLMSTILILSLAILACGGLTITVNRSDTPTSIPQIIASEKPAPSQISVSTEIPTSATGTNYDLYAGFTKNNPVSFVILHKSGEKLGSYQSAYLNFPSYIIWAPSSGEAVTIYANKENGLPKSAVIGSDIVLYSNYTDATVDLTLIHSNGSREAIRVTRNTDILNKISAIFTPSLALAAHPMPVSFNPQAEEILNFTKADLYLLSAAGCIGGVAAGVAAPPALLLLADACTGFILTTAVQVGKMANLNVANLDTLNQKVDIIGCALIDATDCLNVSTDLLDNYLQHSNYIIANIPAQQVAPNPVPHPGTYP